MASMGRSSATPQPKKIQQHPTWRIVEVRRSSFFLACYDAQVFKPASAGGRKKGGGPSRTENDYGARAEGRAGLLHQDRGERDGGNLRDPPHQRWVHRRVGARNRRRTRQKPQRGVFVSRRCSGV